MLLPLLSTSAWAQQSGPQYYHDHMWGNWHGWFMGPIMMIVVIGFVVALIVLLVRWLGGHGHASQSHNPTSNAPLDILKERFAKGEIDKDEYEERRKVLE